MSDFLGWLLLWSIPTAFLIVVAVGGHYGRQHPTSCYVYSLYDIRCFSK